MSKSTLENSTEITAVGTIGISENYQISNSSTIDQVSFEDKIQSDNSAGLAFAPSDAQALSGSDDAYGQNIIIEIIEANESVKSESSLLLGDIQKVLTSKHSTVLQNKDHNYSEITTCKKKDRLVQEDVKQRTMQKIPVQQKVISGSKEKIGQKITNINDLKKATPLVKLPVLLSPPITKNNFNRTEGIREELHKYCRTCAGLKMPLVDIFGERGIQMRLNQQMRHLEEIDKSTSLSTQMCMDCICDLKMSYKFFMQIKKAEMKLKSIHASLNETHSKISHISEQKIVKDIPKTIPVKEIKSPSPEIKQVDQYQCKPVSINTTILPQQYPNILPSNDDIDHDGIKGECADYDYYENIQHQDELESIEEFDPDDVHSNPDLPEGCENEYEFGPKDQNTEINSLNQLAYTFDESLNAYVKIDRKQDNKCESAETNIVATDPAQCSDHAEAEQLQNQAVKQPNILKRKLSSDLKNEGNVDKTVNKIDFQKINFGPKDSKIQKLNVHETLNIKTEEEGIMYVTVKGNNPNELLLVKVKKMDKPSDKKVEKVHGKKKNDIISSIKSFIGKDESTLDRAKVDPKDHYIEEQIEEYKKKREKILGEQLNLAKAEDGIRSVKESFVIGPQDQQTIIMEELDETEIKPKIEQDIEIGENLVESDQAFSTPQSSARISKLRQRWAEIKKKHDIMNKDLAQTNSIDRLRSVLGGEVENLQEFLEYLKIRRIVVSRLKDEDIISLYETKNNVNLNKNVVETVEIEAVEEDPFVEKETFHCDWCFKQFPNKELSEEHAKSHDLKLLHYCDDCDEEFPTNKARRNHNVTCIKKLLCKHCDILLDSKGKKRQHEQKHCDDLYGQLCDMCGERFKHQGTLDQHVKTRHMELEKTFQCPKCPKKFAFKTKLSFHLKSVHTSMRAYLCEDCGADFKNPASLRHHRIRKHQPISNKRECPVCKKSVPVYSLSKHMHTHKAYTIKCPHCDKMFKNSSTLKQHTRIHEDQRQYRCDMCGVGFNRRDGLRLHLKVHEKGDSRGLKECSCQVCGEKFPNHSMLVIHRNRNHKDGRHYTCHICNRSMISTRSLEWHLSHIHNESMPGIPKSDPDSSADIKRVSCYHCDKTFKTEMILRTHIKNTHVEKDPMKCLDCDETFTSEVRLRHHMMTAHNRLEGTLGCPHCTKRFVNSLRLKTHMISHSEERPYTCEICGFNLKTKIQLIKHRQNRHSDERPLQCRYCTWRCKQVSALVCHERTHTNERPYSCSECNQKFKYLGDKNKHERRHESLGGAGFKRIVSGRNTRVKKKEPESTGSEPDQEEYEITGHFDDHYQEVDETFVEKYEEKLTEDQVVKFETSVAEVESYNAAYEETYEETSQDIPDGTQVIMTMEDPAVYTEEVGADEIESTEIITDDMMTSQILQPGTVVHLQQQDETGQIQVIPVMLSLPDLTDGSAEVNLATASIMYNN